MGDEWVFPNGKKVKTKKLSPEEVEAVSEDGFRKSEEETHRHRHGDWVDYLFALDAQNEFEGHRIYGLSPVAFISSNGQFHHLCLSTILGHTMPHLVFVWDQDLKQIIGHYFAPATNFP